MGIDHMFKKGRREEGMMERRDEGMTGRRDDGTTGRRDEGTIFVQKIKVENIFVNS